MIEETQNNVSNKDIYQLLQAINTKNTSIESRLERIEKNLSSDVKAAQQKIANLEAENRLLKDQLMQIQKIQKKYNIVIYGIDEKEADLYKTVQEIINIKLEIQCEPIEFRDVHRLGKAKQTDKARPVLVELVSYNKKLMILKNCHKLKGTKIAISNDLTTEEQKEKRILLFHLKQARERKYNAKIYRNKLIINGETYGIEDLQEIDLEISDIDSDIHEIPTTSKKNSNSTPATPTYHQSQENPGDTLPKTEEKNVRNLRSNVSNMRSNTTSADRKRPYTDNKEEKDNKKMKN